MADALVGWIKDGLCYGPLDEDEVPWDDYTVNPITVKIKPNGKARICIDMSSPHPNASATTETPSSVNSGINAEEFPASMSSTKTFCESLMKAGCPGEFCKIDWNQAYKNIPVREQDHKLQIFSFGGKFFGEVRLTFGCTSSAGHFDDTAKLIKRLAEKASGINPNMVNQVLDNVVACGAKGDGSVGKFYKVYREICKEVGVSLADEADPDKAFNVSKQGKVLGIL